MHLLAYLAHLAKIGKVVEKNFAENAASPYSTKK